MKQDFKGKKVCIHCPSADLAEQVRLILGYPINFGKHNYQFYRDKYCLDANYQQYCYTTWYIKNKYTIIQAQDFIRDNQEKLEFSIFN